MHTFQPYPIDMLDINPFTKLSKEWALVTAGDKEKSNTMTVSWGGTGVLWGKNVVFIFIRESRYTKNFIDNGEFFSLSFLSEKYRDALKYCGAHLSSSCPTLITPLISLSIGFENIFLIIIISSPLNPRA